MPVRFIFLSGKIEFMCGVARGFALRVCIRLVGKRAQTIVHVWISLFVLPANLPSKFLVYPSQLGASCLASLAHSQHH